MSKERWERIEKSYLAARELGAAERAAFLDEACAADADLRSEVESLLRQDAKSVSFMNAPIVEFAGEWRSTVTAGTRLGPYEIVDPIGAGGMGEVYRARDTRLNRTVAIKVLPRNVLNRPDAKLRFKREAETIATLNHPHICVLHDVGDQDGIDFLVMEYLEGQTLAERISRRPLPIAEALEIARQIADALGAAHGKGIVHRDLKPANVKIAADGTVKVLDFGLAKIFVTDGEQPAGTAVWTANRTILGTVAYMSPEQAHGKTVDKRADIWAFGVVLYEMVTGGQLFQGEDVTVTLAAVVTKEPDLTVVPERVRRVLARCLEKDPNRRLRDISGVELLLDEVSAPVAAVRPDKPARLPWTVAAVAVVALGVALWAPWRVEKPVDRPLARLDVDLGADVSFPAINSGNNIAISPDGTRLVYASGTPRKLFTRRLDQPQATELPGTHGVVEPFFSPDGQWVGYAVGRKVNKISLEGGAVVPVGEVGNFAGASWAEDGSIFVGDFGKGLLQFPAAGGSPKIVAPMGTGELGLVAPQLLPGGKAILVAACALGGADNCNVEVLTLADGGRKILARGGQSPHYLPSSNGNGHLVYINKATLFAIPFDPATLETRGRAVPVLDDVGYGPATGGGLFEVSRIGTLIYRRSSVDHEAMTTMQWLDSSGKKEPLRAKPGAYQTPRVSPDGKRIGLAISEGPNQDVFIYDPQRDGITRLTFGGINSSPVWSPDGQYVVFAKLGQGIFQARADGASPPQVLTGSKVGQFPWSFTPDGKRLAYYEATGKEQIWTVPLADQGGQLEAGKPEQFLKSNFQDSHPSFSPDGRWLAYNSNESGKDEVYVRSFPAPSSGRGRKWQVSNSGAAAPRWSRAGQELLYRSGDQLMTVSYSVKGDTFVAEKPRLWFATFGSTAWDLAPDGKRVAALIPEAAAQAPQREHVIVMLQNFFDELRRRVPLGK